MRVSLKMKIKEAEQSVYISDRWWKYSIFAPGYWSWVLLVWIIGNLVGYISNKRRTKRLQKEHSITMEEIATAVVARSIKRDEL